MDFLPAQIPGALESMDREEQIELSSLRVVNPVRHADFPFQVGPDRQRGVS